MSKGSDAPMSDRVRQLRLVIEAEDFEAAVAFYRWRSLNSRLDAPAGLQITLFQELDS